MCFVPRLEHSSVVGEATGSGTAGKPVGMAEAGKMAVLVGQ